MSQTEESLCPKCGNLHTRREEALDCLEAAGRRDRPFSPGAEESRELLILTSRYYGTLPTEPIKTEEVRTKASVITWTCPYQVLCKMPNPETTIPHPSNLAIALDTVTVNRRVYQCVDCLLLFTDCVVNNTPTDCKATRCRFYEDFDGKHEVMMRHMPKVELGQLILGDPDYVPRTKKAISSKAI